MIEIAFLDQDVLSEIFERAIDVSEGRISTRCAPLNLSHTCQAWRVYLLANGRFWTHLNCYNVDRYDPRLISLWTKRSKECIANILIGPHFQGTVHSKDEDLEQSLRHVFQIQSRIELLKVVGHTLARTTPEPTLLHDISNLTNLELHHNFPIGKGRNLVVNCMHSPLLYLPLDLGTRSEAVAPRLVKLVLTGLSDDPDVQGGVLAMLTQCPNIKELELSMRMPKPRSPVPNHGQALDAGRIILANLESFSFKAYYYFQLLRHIRAPSLRSLCVMACVNASSFVVAHDVRRLLLDSDNGASVQCAHLFFINISNEDQIALLQAMPNITMLEANFPCTNQVLEKFVLDKGDQVLCRQLEQLDITVSPREGIEVARRMLLSRFNYSESFKAWVEIGRLTDELVTSLTSRLGMHRFTEEGRLNGPDNARQSKKKYGQFLASCSPIEFART